MPDCHKFPFKNHEFHIFIFPPRGFCFKSSMANSFHLILEIRDSQKPREGSFEKKAALKIKTALMHGCN